MDYFALSTMRIRTSRKMTWSSRYQAGAGYYHQTKVWTWGSYQKATEHTLRIKRKTLAGAQTPRKAQNTLEEPKVNPSYKSGSRAKTFNQTQAGSQWKMNRRVVESQTM